jgi:tetratricopeptide (TPR) repeat protein
VTDTVRPLLALAREHHGRNDHTAAETLLREILRQDSDLADAHHLLGSVLHARNDLAGARQAFQRALALAPKNTDAALSLAITCNELGLYSEAMRVTNNMGRGARADSRIDAFARARLADLHAEVARGYEALSLWPEAAEEYRKALGLRPELSDLRVRLGVVLRADGDLDGALAEHEATVVRQPDHAQARVALGLTLFRIGRKTDAELQWRKALELDATLRPAEVYLRMLERDDVHLPSLVPPPPTTQGVDADEELANMKVSLLGDREPSR